MDMEDEERKDHADGLDGKPSFRKPLNDAAGRNYRRHSPVDGSDASLSDGSPKHGKRKDAFSSREYDSRMSDRKRRDDTTDTDRDRRSRTRRDDRETYLSKHYGRDYRDDSDKGYYRSSKAAHDSRDGDHSPLRKKEGNPDRSKETSQRSDKFNRDMSDNGHRNEDKIADRAASRRHGYNESDLPQSGSRLGHPRKDGDKTAEYRHSDRRSRDDRRERRRSPPESYKSGNRSYDEVRGHAKNPSRDLDAHEDRSSRRKRERKEYDRDQYSYEKESEEHIRNNNRGSSSFQERERRNMTDEAGQGKGYNSPGKKKSDHSESFTESAKILPETKASEVEMSNVSSSKFSSEPPIPSVSHSSGTPNHGAAAVAAMKAAEIVNRNLMGGGGLSVAEQKKKLLWGNKKNADESSSQWDLSLFPDRERQEKFKKLMGVKGDLKVETKPEDKDGNLRAKQQEELQMDLEKQYTAGLRRRDGRTVGLGL